MRFRMSNGLCLLIVANTQQYKEHKMRKFLNHLIACMLLAVSVNAFAQHYSPPYNSYQPQYVGIPSARMNFVAAAQENSQWCWAASIQMVLNYYGVSITQPQIVARTYGIDPYGNLPDWPGSFQAITANLNNWSVDNTGRQYSVQASLNWGAPSPSILLQELSNGRPVIVGYRTGENSGHAVVITAASYTVSNNGPIIQSVVARDPWPSNENIRNAGRVEYTGGSIASLMQAYWYIRVY